MAGIALTVFDSEVVWNIFYKNNNVWKETSQLGSRDQNAMDMWHLKKKVISAVLFKSVS